MKRVKMKNSNKKRINKKINFVIKKERKKKQKRKTKTFKVVKKKEIT